MRIGLISDVHANLAALRAVLSRLEADGVEHIVCAGDVVGYGPQPNECVEVLASAGVTCVAGNHDLMAIGVLDASRRAPLVARSSAFTDAELSGASRGWLAALPRVATFGADGLGEAAVVIAHGSLEDAERYVERDETSSQQLDALARRFPGATALVLGHTHRPRHFRSGAGSTRPGLRGGRFAAGTGPLVCNPGSVGQSRQPELEPRARCAVIELGEGGVRAVEYCSLRYDVAATRRLLAQRNLPAGSVHLVPGRAGALGRRLAGALRPPRVPLPPARGRRSG